MRGPWREGVRVGCFIYLLIYYIFLTNFFYLFIYDSYLWAVTLLSQ